MKILSNCIFNGFELNTKHKVNHHISIGKNNIFQNGVIISGEVIIGDNNRFSHYNIIGGTPNIIDIKELGIIDIGKNNIFKEFVSIHNSSSIERKTIIQNSCFIQTNVHIGHDSTIADNVILCANVIIAGHVTIMHHANMGLSSTTTANCVVGPYCMINANLFVTHNVLPYTVYTNRLNGINMSSQLNVIGLSRGNISDNEMNEYEDWLITKKDSMFNTLIEDKWFKNDINNFISIMQSKKRRFKVSTFAASL